MNLQNISGEWVANAPRALAIADSLEKRCRAGAPPAKSRGFQFTSVPGKRGACPTTASNT
jgi:hypothetical protein